VEGGRKEGDERGTERGVAHVAPRRGRQTSLQSAPSDNKLTLRWACRSVYEKDRKMKLATTGVELGPIPMVVGPRAGTQGSVILKVRGGE
jgi:hypothetical protein